MTDKIFVTRDLLLAAYFKLKGYEPAMVKGSRYVDLKYPDADFGNLYMIKLEFEGSNIIMVNLRDYVQAVRDLQAQVKLVKKINTIKEAVNDDHRKSKKQ